MNGVIIRPYRPADAIPLATLYHRAVNEGAALKYDAEQRAAWSPQPPTSEGWRARVEEAETLVAERDGAILGFMTLDVAAGFVDFAYVAPDVMGQGVASALYAVIEGRARVKGHAVLETEASLLAEPFFLRQGWRVVQRQEVERCGVKIPNARMEKRLIRRFAAA
ncbi:GNAT family N-acetyltransferase [Jannaschia sp. CCS1]|uniref:GNAT family N-acetyltransferase n=1 Tax=Jannaschia sp. (strain CCS1) TaxID=290400 RepID=UPI000053B11A|nr:GNAT family N-acetyltransferase [Jannaschia sp. CCS1]ABD54772.1 Acetyltransferase, GNAT family [Jannaschia sp. CCS1]